jgi:hypothetical protein
LPDEPGDQGEPARWSRLASLGKRSRLAKTPLTIPRRRPPSRAAVAVSPCRQAASPVFRGAGCALTVSTYRAADGRQPRQGRHGLCQVDPRGDARPSPGRCSNDQGGDALHSNCTETAISLRTGSTTTPPGLMIQPQVSGGTCRCVYCAQARGNPDSLATVPRPPCRPTPTRPAGTAPAAARGATGKSP